VGGFEHLSPGDSVGQWEIERQLGRGAYATVYLARHILLGRQVALKVFATTGGEVAEPERERILDEARLIGNLKSHHVVTLYGVHPIGDGGLMFEMEYMEGGTLEELLEREPRQPPHTSLEILRGIACGLKVAHEKRIVHGDLKPANVLLDRAGTAKLADFGLARMFRDPGLALSIAADLVGTPRYMAPEVIMGGKPSPASDVWGFGVVLYQVLAGLRPFEGHNLNALFYAIQNAPPPPLDPGVPPDLVHLTQRCLEKEPAKRPEEVAEVIRTLERVTPRAIVLPPKSAAEPVVSGPVFGRNLESARLEGLLEKVESGAGAAVLITGEAGIGKTTLLTEMAARASRRGFAWIQSRITSVEGLLRPLLRALREHFPERELEQRFGSSAPVLAELLREEPESLESHQQLVWAVERLLQAMAADEPLGVFVEDAHEAGIEEMRLLADLATRLAPERALLAITYRIHDPREHGDRKSDAVRYQDLTARREFEHVELGPLSPEAVVRILEQVAEGRRIAPEIARRITQLAEGNPLFAKELLGHLEEQGAIVREDERLTPGPTWTKGRLPRRIRDLVTRRLDGLTEQQRAIALDLPLLPVLRALQNLYRERGVVTPQPTGYRFAHSLFQEVIHDEIAPDLRTALHRRLAEHLESRGPAAGVDPERIGTHWERGGQHERAAPYLLKAARAAEGRQELRRTIDLCSRAGITPGEIDSGTALEHAEELTCLAICYGNAGEHDKAEAVFDALLKAAEGAGNERLRMDIFIAHTKTMFEVKGLGAVDRGDLERATEVLPDSVTLARAHQFLGRLAKERGDLEQAADHCREADRVSAAIGQKAGQSDALDEMAQIARLRGKLEEAEKLFAMAARLSAQVGRRSNAAISEFNRALAAFDQGSFDGLEASMERSISTLELEGMRSVAAQGTVVLSHVLYAMGDVEGARRRIKQAHDLLEETGSIPGLLAAHIAEAQLATHEGRLADAARALDEARKAAETRGIVTGRVFAAQIAVPRLCLEGRIEEAEREAVGALELARAKGGAKVWSELVLRLAEAAMNGLPVSVLDDVQAEDERLTDLARRFLAGVRAYSAPEAASEPLQAASKALLSPGFGERRAVLHILGKWFRAEALWREGVEEAAIRDAQSAVDDAHALGHIGHEAGLLAVLHAWTGEERFLTRRRELLERLERS
jgi:tetratricopeptide (TPR) repeat protein